MMAAASAMRPRASSTSAMTRAESLVQRCTQDMAIEWVGKSTRARPKIKSCFGLRSRSTTWSRPSFGEHGVRIPAVVSDLRTMPDTPKCSVDGCLNGTNPDFDRFVCWAGVWTVFCDSQNERLFAPERQPNPRRGQKDLMLIRYGYELTLNCPRPTTMVCLLDAHREPCGICAMKPG
jgi:hypothetical protein